MAESNQNSSSTFLELRWNSPHLQLGTGYDFGGRHLRESAVGHVDPALLHHSGAEERKLNIHSISTSEDLKSRIKADLKAEIPLQGASITTENSYLTSLQVSKTSLTEIIQETWTGSARNLNVHDLKLTQTASNVLKEPNGWKKFSAKYGEYFVYGYTPRARFSAIVDIKTSSEQLRDEIKTSLTGSTSQASIGASLEAVKSSKKDHVQISIKLDIDGLKHNGEAKPISESTNKVEEVQKLYQSFSQHHELQPYIAHFCHYSVFSTPNIIPNPTDQTAHLGEELNRIYKGLFTAQIELTTSSMEGASSTAKKIAALCETVRTLDLTKSKEIKRINQEFVDYLAEADKWRLREELVEDVGKLKNFKLTKFGEWIEALGQREWASGVLGPGLSGKFNSLRDECTHKQDHFNPSWELAQVQDHTSNLGDHDKVIIGFEITSNWNDDTNGWFMVKSGDVLDSEVQVEIQSYRSRGCDWLVEVWMMPKLRYSQKKIH